MINVPCLLEYVYRYRHTVTWGYTRNIMGIWHWHIQGFYYHIPANTRRWPTVDLLLGQRRWRSVNIKTTLVRCLVGCSCMEMLHPSSLIEIMCFTLTSNECLRYCSEIHSMNNSVCWNICFHMEILSQHIDFWKSARSQILRSVIEPKTDNVVWCAAVAKATLSRRSVGGQLGVHC